MNLLGTALVKELPDEKIGTVDSTPLEASRYHIYPYLNSITRSEWIKPIYSMQVNFLSPWCIQED